MRIAQIAPLHEAVPPKLYGGTERVVSYLTEALVEMGHDVTLFASGDSQTSAKLEACWPQALRLDPTIRDVMAPHMLLLEQVRRRAEEFDVLHCHIDYYPFSLFSRQPVPHLTTMHGRLDLPELQPIFNAFSDVPVVSISDNQRIPLPQANWLSTVYHGLPENLLTPIPNVKPSYLAFLGRISPEKRVDTAPSRPACRSRSPRSSTRPTARTTKRRSSRCSSCRTSSTSAKSASRRRPNSSATRMRCCSRSTGRSPSAW